MGLGGVPDLAQPRVGLRHRGFFTAVQGLGASPSRLHAPGQSAAHSHVCPSPDPEEPLRLDAKTPWHTPVSTCQGNAPPPSRGGKSEAHKVQN